VGDSLLVISSAGIPRYHSSRMSDSWLIGDRQVAASDRILDVAGRCFADKGVARTSIGDIAKAAGCSRPTIYRYFEDRDALRRAFVQREALRLAAKVLNEVHAIKEPRERLVISIIRSIEEVRSNPILVSWFSNEDSHIASRVAGSSSAIESLAIGIISTENDAERELRARWIIRIILSLLTMPGHDAQEEREMIEKFVVPVVTDP